jgi:hypothetical protein
MKLKFVSTTNYQSSVIADNSSLRNYLLHLAIGRKATPHSWLFEDEETSETVSRWIRQLKTANHTSPFGDLFTDFDMEKLKRLKPQGEVPPLHSKEAEEVLEPLFESSEYDNELALKEFFSETERFAKWVFGGKYKRCRPKSFTKVIEDMDERDTLFSNSGFPRFTVRDTVVSEEIEDAKSGKAFEYPAVILFREYRAKLRPVWMYPMSMNLLEYQFTQVIQEAIRTSQNPKVREWVSPWEGFEEVKKTITKQYKSSKIIGGDTTKMDAHMRKAQIRLVYEIVKWLFPEKYWDQLYRVMMQVNMIDLITGTDERLTGPHGLASGSGWTQLVETILVLFIAWLHDLEGQGIGDDFILLSTMTAEELVALLAKFGLPANPDKQTIEEEWTTFLQRLFHKLFFSREDNKVLGAYYSTIWALITMCQPERYWNPKYYNSNMFCSRIYMILENTIDDPCFEEFAKFVIKGQKDLKDFAKKSVSELDAITEETRRLRGLNPTYNREKMGKPLSKFESIRFVASL